MVLTPRHAPSMGLQESRARDQMRRQLEIVIRKNEEILSGCSSPAPRPRPRPAPAAPRPTASAGPLNLSVRKDLMKPKTERENVNVALEKLIARYIITVELQTKVKRMFPKISPSWRGPTRAFTF